MKLSNLNNKAIEEYKRIVSEYIQGKTNNTIKIKIVNLNNKYGTDFKAPGY